MGFNGGGGGALPAHEHTNIVNDGGPLDFNNTTIASMAAGDMTYSDGVALQPLNIGGAGEYLQVSGGVPSWQAFSGGAWTVLDSVNQTTSTTELSINFTAMDIMKIFWSCSLDVGASDDWTVMRFNGDSGNNYMEKYSFGAPPALAGNYSQKNQPQFILMNSQDYSPMRYGEMTIFSADNSGEEGTGYFVEGQVSMGRQADMEGTTTIHSGFWNSAVALTSIEIYGDLGTVGGSGITGGYAKVLGINI